jgi:hypothetical protein
MPIVPVRGLGSVGIITDIPPTDLPSNAWSDGRNVRFYQGRVERAPIFRTLVSSVAVDEVSFVYGLYNLGGYDSILYAGRNGRVRTWVNGVDTNRSIGLVDTTPTSLPWTACTLSGVVYLNRVDIVPRSLPLAASNFANLPNWDSTWRCAALRPFGSQLVALNVTKGLNNFPQLVKVSDTVTYGNVPVTWDQTDTTKLAVENTLSQARTPIVDGGTLGNDFIIYTRDEAWKMQNVGGQFLFDFVRLPFDNAGLINQNCYVEIDGKHYAWSENDIYVHDGVSKQSIADQRVRDTFFSQLNVSKSNVFFAAHDRLRSEVLFCCISAAGQHATDATYCNFAAVYNYRNNTWSFRDMPNVAASSSANTNTVATWSTIPGTWDETGGSWFDQEDSFSRHCVFAILGNSSMGISGIGRIEVLDFADKGKLALPRDADAAVNPIAWVQRDGLHFEEAGADTRSYKHVRSVALIGSAINNDTTLRVRLSGDSVKFTPTSTSWEYGPSVAPLDPRLLWNPFTDYKHDTRVGGKYITIYFDCPTPNDFSIDGYDMDVLPTGRR